MKEFVRRYNENAETADVDIAIKCSGVPDMYIRIIQKPKDRKMEEPLVLISLEKGYFKIPRIRDTFEERNDESLEEW